MEDALLVLQCKCGRRKALERVNAIRAALQLYLIRIRSGRLPDALPPGLPRDLFSDQDFEYERTQAGFVLRCRAKDPSKDETIEYTFKVE